MTIDEAKAMMASAADLVAVVKALFDMPVEDRRLLVGSKEFKAFVAQHGRNLMHALTIVSPPGIRAELIPAQARDAGHIFQRLKWLTGEVEFAGCDRQISDQTIIDKLHAWEAQSGGLVHASVALDELAVVRPFAVGFFMSELTKTSV